MYNDIHIEQLENYNQLVYGVYDSLFGDLFPNDID